MRKNVCGNCRVSGPVEECNFLCELIVGMSLSLPKLSLSLCSETSERVSAYNSYKILSSCRTFLRKAMIATEGKQKAYLNEWSLCCSLMVLKIGGQDRFVCLFVTWDPSILQQAVDNLEAISDPDHLTNACVGRHVRKHRNAWPINNAWDSNRAFVRGPTAKC